MGNHSKPRLFCLIFAFAVVTSWAENPEINGQEPDKSSIELGSSNEELLNEYVNFNGELVRPSTRVKRGDMTRSWPDRNPLRPRATPSNAPNPQPGRNPQGGQRPPPPPNPNRPPRVVSQRDIDMRQLDNIRRCLYPIFKSYLEQGLSPEAAYERTVRDRPRLAARFFRLRDRNSGFRLNLQVPPDMNYRGSCPS